MYEKVNKEVDTEWLPSDCRPILQRVIKYFLRTRIYYVCSNINKGIAEAPKTKANRKYKILSGV